LKAVDLLTINSDKVILQKQVLELKEKSKDSEYIIKAKLQDKDDEIKIIKEQIQALILAVNSMKDQNQINNFAQHLYDSRIIKSPSTD
jgi:hypothetical protein